MNGFAGDKTCLQEFKTYSAQKLYVASSNLHAYTRHEHIILLSLMQRRPSSVRSKIFHSSGFYCNITRLAWFCGVLYDSRRFFTYDPYIIVFYSVVLFGIHADVEYQKCVQ